MARRNRRAQGEALPRPLFGGALRYEDRGGVAWAVRSVSGTAATKTYRCPGCNQEVRPGVAHVVTWPADELEGSRRHEAERSCRAEGGSQERRHWHTGCWRRGGPVR